MQDFNIITIEQRSRLGTRRTSPTYQSLTLLLLALLLVGCIIGIVVPAGLGWDFANFYDAGRRVAAGQLDDLYSPFSLIHGKTPQGTTGFYGSPISALLYVPLSWFSAGWALILFKISNVLAFFAALTLLFVFCRPFVSGASADHANAWQFSALFVFLSLIYQPFWTVFRVGGQTTPFAFLLLTLVLLFHVNGNVWGSSLLMVLAVLIKPALGLAALFLLMVSGWSYLVAITTIGAAFAVVSLLAMGWSPHVAFMHLAIVEAQATYAWYYNSSLYVPIANMSTAFSGSPPWLFTGAAYLMKATVVATLAFLTIRSRSAITSPRARRHFNVVMALLFFLMWSTTLWEHYLAMLFPFLIYIVSTREYFSRQAIALVAVIFALSVGQNLIFTDYLRRHLAFQSVPALLGIGLFKSGPLLLTLVLLWRHHNELFRSYKAPAWREIQAGGWRDVARGIRL